MLSHCRAAVAATKKLISATLPTESQARSCLIVSIEVWGDRALRQQRLSPSRTEYEVKVGPGNGCKQESARQEKPDFGGYDLQKDLLVAQITEPKPIRVESTSPVQTHQEQ